MIIFVSVILSGWNAIKQEQEMMPEDCQEVMELIVEEERRSLTTT